MSDKIVTIILTIVAGLFLGAMVAGGLSDADLWARSETQDQIERRAWQAKQDALIAEFELVNVYYYGNGKVVVEEK
jgi:hypothetical protein